MDEKAFEILTKIYSDFSKKFEALEEGQKELKSEIQQNSNHITRLENEFKDKFGAIKDELSIVRGDISEVKSDVKQIKEKVERHDIKIQVIEGGKKKKAK